MQNFDFNSLYSSGANAHQKGNGFYRPGVNDYSPNSPIGSKPVGGNSLANAADKKKRSNLPIIILAMILISFALGLAAGIQFANKNNPSLTQNSHQTMQPKDSIPYSQQIGKHQKEENTSTDNLKNESTAKTPDQPSTKTKENTIASRKMNSAKSVETIRHTDKTAAAKKVYIKLSPRLNTEKARQIATFLLKKKLPVHYSVMSDGFFYIYIGPYKSSLTGEKIIAKVQEINDPDLSRMSMRLIER